MDVGDLIARRSKIDDELLEEIETHLLMADVGVEATGHRITSYNVCYTKLLRLASHQGGWKALRRITASSTLSWGRHGPRSETFQS